MASENEEKINDANETDNKDTEEILLPTSKNSGGITKDPNFAVVCSFIKIFGPLLHFKELSIETLQQFFDSPTQGITEYLITYSFETLNLFSIITYLAKLIPSPY